MLIGDAKEIWKTAKKEGYKGKRTSAEVRTEIPSRKKVREKCQIQSSPQHPKTDLEQDYCAHKNQVHTHSDLLWLNRLCTYQMPG